METMSYRLIILSVKCTSSNLLCHLTNFLELRSSSKASNCAATQELPSILLNLKVHYRVQKSSSLSQIDPVHITPSYLSKIHFNVIHHLCLGLPSVSFLLAFLPISYMYSFSSLSYNMPCPSHSI
jgi:hypothetical protein